MYESPLNIIYGEIQTKIIEERENQAIQALQNYGISVDKEELIKALMYDRQQYEKGYADAKAEEKWIPCNERLPKPYEYCLWTTTDGRVVYHHCDGLFSNYTAWMPLPEPYEERRQE